MSDNTYNGWTNYETWAVKLWIDNDQGSQTEWLEAARDCAANTPADERIGHLAELLELHHQDGEGFVSDALADVPGAGVYIDLLRASLGSVNWREIASNLLEEYAEILVTP